MSKNGSEDTRKYIDAVIECYKKGVPAQETARITGATLHTVHNIINGYEEMLARFRDLREYCHAPLAGGKASAERGDK